MLISLTPRLRYFVRTTAALSQKGLRDGLGDQADKLIVKELTYEESDPTVNSQIVTLKSSGANTFYDVGYYKVRLTGDPQG